MIPAPFVYDASGMTCRRKCIASSKRLSSTSRSVIFLVRESGRFTASFTSALCHLTL